MKLYFLSLFFSVKPTETLKNIILFTDFASRKTLVVKFVFSRSFKDIKNELQFVHTRLHLEKWFGITKTYQTRFIRLQGEIFKPLFPGERTSLTSSGLKNNVDKVWRLTNILFFLFGSFEEAVAHMHPIRTSQQRDSIFSWGWHGCEKGKECKKVKDVSSRLPKGGMRSPGLVKSASWSFLA